MRLRSATAARPGSSTTLTGTTLAKALLAGALSGLLTVAAFAAPPDLSAPYVLPGDEILSAAAGIQEQPSIAAGGDQYLTVWTDARSSATFISGFTNGPYFSPGVGTMRDIYAARLDAAGDLIDTIPIVIDASTMNQGFADVAWNGENWLVVWMGQAGISCCAHVNIYAARVSPSGVVLDDPPIVVDADATWNGLYWPTVASDGSDWAVIWRDLDEPVGIFTIDGARVSAQGAVIDAGGKRLRRDTWNSYPTWPDIVFAGDEYLMVWEENSGTIRGQRLSPSLDRVGSAFRINPASDTGYRPAVASVGSTFFVAWFHDAWAWNQVLASRISHTGVVLDPAAITVTPVAGYTLFDPDVVWDGVNWIIGYNRDVDGSDGDLFVSRVSTAGLVLDPNGIPVATAAGRETEPRLSARPNGGARLVWQLLGNGPAFVQDIYSTGVSGTGAVGAVDCIALGAPRQTKPDFVSSGDAYLAVFLSETSSVSRVLGQRVSSNGTAIDLEPFEIASAPFGLTRPSVAWDGVRYLVTWSTLESVVYARRVAEDGSMLDPQPIQVMPGNAPDVAVLDGVFLVAATYAQDPHFRYPFIRRIRGSDGAKLDPTPVMAGWNFATRISVAALGNRWLLAWQQNPSHDNSQAEVAATFIAANGLVGEPFYVTNTALTYETEPFISAGSDTALIGWAHDPTGAYNDDLKGRRIMSNGTLLDAAPLTITAAAGLQVQGAMAWTGAEHAALFTDFRSDNADGPYVGDVYGTRLTGEGLRIDTDDFAFANDPEVPELDPTVAGAGGQAALGCAVFHPETPYASYRITLRILNPDQAASGIDDRADLGFDHSYPNPSTGTVRLDFSLEQSGPAHVVIFDARGRVVRDLGGAALPAGRAVIEWDGRGDSGQFVAAGVYFARIQAGGREARVKITRR